MKEKAKIGFLNLGVRREKISGTKIRMAKKPEKQKCSYRRKYLSVSGGDRNLVLKLCSRAGNHNIACREFRVGLFPSINCRKSADYGVRYPARNDRLKAAVLDFWHKKLATWLFAFNAFAQRLPRVRKGLEKVLFPPFAG